MKELFTRTLKHPLFAGSALMVIGSNAANVLNYLFQLIMGRLLTASQYGELSALFSILNLIGIIPQSLNLLIVKFISEAKEKKEIKGLINWFSKRITIFTILVFAIISLLSGPIALFLNIEHTQLVILTALTFVFSLQTFLNRSILQGLLNFKAIIITMFLENGAKLILGALLVYLGFAVLGAITGVVLAGIFAYIITGSYLKGYKNAKDETKPENKEILKFTLPVLGQSIAATSLISVDLILVKHFFSPIDAGLYAAVATLGKIVFFATGPVLAVMLPLIAKRKSQKQNYRQIFLLSLALNLLITLSAVCVFYLIPNLIVSISFANNYPEAPKYLGLYGIFMTFYTICTLFINYFLMLGKTRIVILPLIAAAAQIIGIYLFHQNLISVIHVSIFITFSLVISLFLIYFKKD